MAIVSQSQTHSTFAATAEKIQRLSDAASRLRETTAAADILARAVAETISALLEDGAIRFAPAELVELVMRFEESRADQERAATDLEGAIANARAST